MISAMKMTAENYDRKMTELREFGHQRKLPKSLQMRLMSYNKFLYQNGTVFDAKAILGELPLHMRRDVVYGIYGDLIKESYFFLGIQHNDSAVMRICMELKETAALLGDEISMTGRTLFGWVAHRLRTCVARGESVHGSGVNDPPV